MDGGTAIRRALDYLDANIGTGADVDGAIGASGYSRSQFHAVFGKVTGLTPAEYIRVRRLTLACWDLAFSRQRIIDIAVNRGFTTQEAFTRAFQKRFGVTPGRFRNAGPRRDAFDASTLNSGVYPKDRVLEGVMRVGYRLEDGRSPENIPFPSCLASVMRYLGRDYPWIPIHAHDREWRLNYANVHFLGATGMAFGFMWKEGWHDDNTAPMFIADPRTIVDKAMKAAGHGYDIVEKAGNHEQDESDYRLRIMDSVCRGVPVLAFGVVGPPECCIITGYLNHGETLVGWNFFQDNDLYNHGCTIRDDGYFEKSGWFRDTWNLVVIGREQGSRSGSGIPTNLAMLKWAHLVLGQRESLGRHAGSAAYEAWIRHLLDEAHFADADEDTLKRYHDIHRKASLTLAECRAWAYTFLETMGTEEPGLTEPLGEAAHAFIGIHNLMWRVWDLCGGVWNPEAWRLFAQRGVREAMADLILRAKALDETGAEWLGKAVSGKFDAGLY